MQETGAGDRGHTLGVCDHAVHDPVGTAAAAAAANTHDDHPTRAIREQPHTSRNGTKLQQNASWNARNRGGGQGAGGVPYASGWL
jgi:hypothetical protein